MKKREERFPSWPGEKPETHEERKSETGTPNNVSKTRQNLPKSTSMESALGLKYPIHGSFEKRGV